MTYHSSGAGCTHSITDNTRQPVAIKTPGPRSTTLESEQRHGHRWQYNQVWAANGQYPSASRHKDAGAAVGHAQDGAETRAQMAVPSGAGSTHSTTGSTRQRAQQIAAAPVAIESPGPRSATLRTERRHGHKPPMAELIGGHARSATLRSERRLRDIFERHARSTALRMEQRLRDVLAQGSLEASPGGGGGSPRI